MRRYRHRPAFKPFQNVWPPWPIEETKEDEVKKKSPNEQLSPDWNAPLANHYALLQTAKSIIKELIESREKMNSASDDSAGMSFRECDEYFEECAKRYREAKEKGLDFLQKTAE